MVFFFERSMMLQINWKRARSLVVVAALAVAGTVALTPSRPVAAQSRGLPDFTELVEQVGPSVVNIRTSEKASSRANSDNGPDDQMLEFFRRFGLPMPDAPRANPHGQRQPQPDEMPRGVGSGFVLTADGFIMTNAHVVDGADEVLVTLTDKREFKAKIVGADKRSDVAVLKIEASGLPAVRLGDVGRLKVGEWVMAIGSPFGLENSVTAGIVSAKQRDTGELLPLIQTDVAINPGNSGGPLINMRGEVVGVNSQIYSRSGGYMGISFAIPIDEAARVSEQLRATGRVSRGRLGVQIGPVSKELAESIGLGKAQGALVGAVETGTPAEKAGIEAGDIIVKFNGKAIEKSSDLPQAVGNTKPGTRSTVTVFRRGSMKDLSLTIGEFDPVKSGKKSDAKEDKSKAAGAQALGLTVAELSDAQKKELRLKGGVRVESVSDTAARAGLREGDVILGLGNTEVNSVKEFEAAAAKADKSKTLSVLVRRGELAQYLLLRPAR
jgi:serine protease Do